MDLNTSGMNPFAIASVVYEPLSSSIAADNLQYGRVLEEGYASHMHRIRFDHTHHDSLSKALDILSLKR